jgi:molybdate transport system ATP-binding protein
MTIILDNLSVDFDEHFQLQHLNWEVQSGQHWVISGGNGAGKSALIAALTGTGNIISGQLQGLPERIGVVSFAAQEALINQERQKDDADILDVISIGTPVRNIIFDDCLDPQTAQKIITKFALDYLLDRAFRKLSTGESRKVMLVRALSCKPQLLLLDEPFEGLGKSLWTSVPWGGCLGGVIRLPEQTVLFVLWMEFRLNYMRARAWV